MKTDAHSPQMCVHYTDQTPPQMQTHTVWFPAVFDTCLQTD